MNRNPHRRGSRKASGIRKAPQAIDVTPLGAEILRLCERLAAKLATRDPDNHVSTRTAIRRFLQAIADGKVTLDDIREALDYLEPRH